MRQRGTQPAPEITGVERRLALYITTKLHRKREEGFRALNLYSRQLQHPSGAAAQPTVRPQFGHFVAWIGIT